MRQQHRLVWLAAGIVLLAVIGGALAYARSHTAITPASQTAKKPSDTKQSTTAKHGATNNATANNSNSKSTTQNQTSTTVSVACQHLTASIAKQVLGGDAASSTPTDQTTLQTASTTVTACAYHAAVNGRDQTVQLVVRTPKGSLGTSENATKFGSERPTSAVTVQGYGQSAYWEPEGSTLNILSNNAWYILSTSQGTQDSAEAVAKLLAAGL
jgi:cytoskeletal protein RodZ